LYNIIYKKKGLKMAQAINTQFDDSIENDLSLELFEGAAPSVQVTLKNAENVYKSFLYLRKMYSNFPAKKTIVAMDTIDQGSPTVIPVPEAVNEIIVSNIGSSAATVDINNMVYTMQVGEKEVFQLIAPDPGAVPAVAGDVLKLSGNVSYIIRNNAEY
jgi:hypothetical protein